MPSTGKRKRPEDEENPAKEEKRSEGEEYRKKMIEGRTRQLRSRVTIVIASIPDAVPRDAECYDCKQPLSGNRNRQLSFPNPECSHLICEKCFPLVARSLKYDRAPWECNYLHEYRLERDEEASKTERRIDALADLYRFFRLGEPIKGKRYKRPLVDPVESMPLVNSFSPTWVIVDGVDEWVERWTQDTGRVVVTALVHETKYGDAIIDNDYAVFTLLVAMRKRPGGYRKTLEFFIDMFMKNQKNIMGCKSDKKLRSWKAAIQFIRNRKLDDTEHDAFFSSLRVENDVSRSSAQETQST